MISGVDTQIRQARPGGTNIALVLDCERCHLDRAITIGHNVDNVPRIRPFDAQCHKADRYRRLCGNIGHCDLSAAVIPAAGGLPDLRAPTVCTSRSGKQQEHEGQTKAIPHDGLAAILADSSSPAGLL